jgi:ubiquinone/menaquinone biosynthesis C-methylase UbiE
MGNSTKGASSMSSRALRLPVSGGDERHASHVSALAETPGFERLREQILERAQPTDSERAVDIGAGSGLLALAVAPRVAHVTAIDSSPAVCRLLEARSREMGIENLDVIAADARELPLEDSSIDLVVSNYCLHHISDDDKRVALKEIARVLRPGGRLVLGDMMFNVGFRTARDRQVVLRLVWKMVRSHPAGLVRVLVNAVKTVFAPSEHPASVQWWEQALNDTGFQDVQVVALEHEGGIGYARRPSVT